MISMMDTPKGVKSAQKRRAVFTENLQQIYDDENDITYDYLPKSKHKKAESCENNLLGQRPEKVVRSPNIIPQPVSSYRLGQKNIPAKEERLKAVQQLCQSMQKTDKGLDKGEAVNSDCEAPLQSNNNLGTTLLDDSTSEDLYILSQQVETNFLSDRSPVMGNTERILRKSSTKDSSISLLLDDGNDAGFCELDETELVNNALLGSEVLQDDECTAQEIEIKTKDTCNFTGSEVLRNGKCTVQEIEIKRKEACNFTSSKVLQNQKCTAQEIVAKRNKTFNFKGSVVVQDPKQIVQEIEFKRKEACNFTSLKALQIQKCIAQEIEVKRKKIFNFTGSDVLQNQKCTAQEIEAKRKEALKKLHERRMKVTKSSYRDSNKR